MSINYHELTMEEAKDSPARKKQFLVICVLGIGFITNTLINSGGLHPVRVEEGIFPGGDFYFQMKSGDYSTSTGHIRCAASTLRLHNDEDHADFLYSMYIDDKSIVDIKDARFFIGAMFDTNDEVNTDERKNKQKQLLMEESKGNNKYDEMESFCTEDVYEIISLPSVKAGVAHAPYTDGFMSAILQDLKIIPAMTKYGKENGVENMHPITITTCSKNQFMCTHFVPLEKTDRFLMGRPNSGDYVKALEKERNTPLDDDTVEKMKDVSPL